MSSQTDKGKGPSLHSSFRMVLWKSGDVIIAGTSVGRIRTMTNDKGRSIIACPSTPVEITGLGEVHAGDVFNAAADEKLCKRAC